MRAQKLAGCMAGLCMAFVLAACQSEKPLPQQRFDLRGKVVSIDKSQGTVMVAHEAIPNFMAAMTMSYRLKDAWAFNILKPGQSIRATLVVTGNDAWLEGIVVTEEAKPESNLVAPEESGRTQLGEELPDFQLINQDGKRIHLHQYHGKALLLTFIYTRCPFPNFCPLMSKNFAQILEQVRSDPKLSPSTHLLSISIDPEYDTPAVLRAYGLDCAGNLHSFDHWEFATGTQDQVRKVAEFFGLKYWTEGGQIMHALVTALIGPDGKVIQIYRGNDWQPAQVVNDLRDIRQATKGPYAQRS
jgi:protein SCO1/2